VTVPHIGIIVECGPRGADELVCRALAAAILGEAQIDFACMHNKAKLLQGAGRAAAELLATGCERVFVVWDLRPAWPDQSPRPCRKIERDQLQTVLKEAGVDASRVSLICVEQELESWLLADAEKLRRFLSTPAHAYAEIPASKNPDLVPNPKAVVIKHFKAARGWRYADTRHAIRVIESGPIVLSRLRRSASFARFEAKLTRP